MSDKKQTDDSGGRAMLGRRCIAVHHGMLWIDARIANILKLSENQELPKPADVDEDEAQPDGNRRKLVVLTPIVRVRPSRKGLFRALAVLAAFMVLWIVQTQRLWSHGEVGEVPVAAPRTIRMTSASPANQAPRRLPAAKVRRDEHGRPLDISGPNAATVLEAFCSTSDPMGGRKPIGISPGQGFGSVFGRFEDISSAETSLAILIYLDPRTGRWRAGNGRRPIEIIRVTRDP